MIKLSKPVYWFDIDDTWLHLWHSLMSAYNKEYWARVPLKDMRTIGPDEACYIVEKYNLYENMPITEIFKMLQKCRNDIYVLLDTSRESKYKDLTIEELARHNIHYDELLFDVNKADVCKRLKVDKFFDDALHNIIDIQQNSDTQAITVKRLWNGSSEILRLKDQWIKCNSDIQRLTEAEIVKLLRNVF